MATVFGFSEAAKPLSDSLILAITSFTLYFYDYILTVNREVRFFWMRGRQNVGMTGLLYILARYLPMVSLFLVISLINVPEDSIRYYGSNCTVKIVYWLAFIGILSAEGILVTRTYAIWRCNKRILIALTLFLFALALPYSVAFNMARNADEFNKVNTASYGLILGFETVILLMTLFQRSKYNPATTPLLRVLYRDGILYYLYTFAISLINLVVVLAGNRIPSQLNVQFLLHSILSTRIVLHIREQGEIELNGDNLAVEMTTLEFRSIVLPISGAS